VASNEKSRGLKIFAGILISIASLHVIFKLTEIRKAFPINMRIGRGISLDLLHLDSTYFICFPPYGV